jgi:hypothetical protein
MTTGRITRSPGATTGTNPIRTPAAPAWRSGCPCR